MSESGTFYLYDSETHQQVAEVEAEGLDLFFPDFVDGWTDVLDCRITPYNSNSIEENCHIAEHVRKPFILVTPAQAKAEAPIAD
jgi:hypothetical protein